MGATSLRTLKAYGENEWANKDADINTDALLEKRYEIYDCYVNRDTLLWGKQRTPTVPTWTIIEKRIAAGIPRDVEEEFYSNVVKWKDETEVSSSMHDLVLNKSYQRIIGLGPIVIPLILKDLKNYGGHWFWALNALTGENPVTQEDAGRIKKMREAWLTWGVEKGYL